MPEPGSGRDQVLDHSEPILDAFDGRVETGAEFVGQDSRDSSMASRIPCRGCETMGGCFIRFLRWSDREGLVADRLEPGPPRLPDAWPGDGPASRPGR